MIMLIKIFKRGFVFSQDYGITQYKIIQRCYTELQIQTERAEHPDRSYTTIRYS